jgi:hypothetical protein
MFFDPVRIPLSFLLLLPLTAGQEANVTPLTTPCSLVGSLGPTVGDWLLPLNLLEGQTMHASALFPIGEPFQAPVSRFLTGWAVGRVFVHIVVLSLSVAVCS